MSYRLFERSISFALAAVLTLGMLGSIDRLAQREEPAPGWAHVTPAAAAQARV